MKLILAPDSFKGSLSAAEAAKAMAEGIHQVHPDAETLLMPLADGGEGTVAALVLATGGRQDSMTVTGPLGEPLSAAYGLLGPSEDTAVVEMASAAGLPLVPSDQRDPRHTTTYGVGELLRHAVNSGAKRIILGLGGSATNDGGAGAMQALGVRFLDAAGNSLPEPLSGGDLVRLAHIDLSHWQTRLENIELLIASDVTNPLLGPNGAAAVYGPQKGASALMVSELEAALTQYAAVLQRDLGKNVADLPGAGAAGGMGAGLMAFLEARAKSGIGLVLDLAQFEHKAAGADWILTGEGKIDAQTLQGKTIAGVLRRAKPLGVRVLAFGGSVDDAATEELMTNGLAAAFPIVSRPMSLEEAMRDGKSLLTQAVARVMRLL
jgi:glycerate kinase